MTNEEFFEKNINLAYKIANKYKINYIKEYDDIKQIALMGLWKAILAYDEGKGNKFSTYAYIVIANEINYYLRQQVKKHKSVKSLEEYTTEIASIKNEDIETIIKDKLENDEFLKIKNEVINESSEKEGLIFNYLQQGKTQDQVAKIFNISQPSISRVRKKIINKIKEKYKEE